VRVERFIENYHNKFKENGYVLIVLHKDGHWLNKFTQFHQGKYLPQPSLKSIDIQNGLSSFKIGMKVYHHHHHHQEQAAISSSRMRHKN